MYVRPNVLTAYVACLIHFQVLLFCYLNSMLTSFIACVVSLVGAGSGSVYTIGYFWSLSYSAVDAVRAMVGGCGGEDDFIGCWGRVVLAVKTVSAP